MPTDQNSTRANEPSEDWGSVEELQDAPLEPGPVYLQDRFFYRVVVCSLASVPLVALIGSIILIACDKSIPDSIVALGSTAVGALASVLVGSRR